MKAIVYYIVYDPVFWPSRHIFRWI